MLKPSIFISKLGMATWKADISDPNLVPTAKDLTTKIQNGVCEVMFGYLPNQIVVKVCGGHDTKEALAVLLTAIYGALTTTDELVAVKSAHLHLASIKNQIKCDTNIDLDFIEKFLTKLISIKTQSENS